MIAPISTSNPSPIPLDLALATRGDRANPPSPQDITKAAKQFEAILLRQLISPAVEPLMSGGLGGAESSSSGGGIFGYFLTDTLANSMAEGGGLGLSAVITRQLTPRPPAPSHTP